MKSRNLYFTQKSLREMQKLLEVSSPKNLFQRKTSRAQLEQTYTEADKGKSQSVYKIRKGIFKIRKKFKL